MDEFDPIKNIERSELILEKGQWPNFHDAEVHYLNIWRGDVRPDDNVWIGPVIEASFELCAIENPFLAILKFHDCDAITMEEFNHQNALYDLEFKFHERGTYSNGKPLPPDIIVTFQQAFGMALSFRCFRIEVIDRQELNNATIQKA